MPPRRFLDFVARQRIWLSVGAVVLLVCLFVVVSVTYDAGQRRRGPEGLADADLEVLLEDYEKGDAQLAKEAGVLKGNSTILFAAVVFRHGDRNPTNPYKNDLYADGSAYIGGWGALTLKGKRRMYKLGQRLRHRYCDLIPPLYVPEHLYVLSSDADRCLMSAESLLAALYPPLPFQRIHPHLDWQPIPVHTVPRAQDRVVSAKSDCPRYSEALGCVYNGSESTQVNNNASDLLRLLTEKSGQEVKNFAQAESLYNTLALQKLLGLKVPEWFDEKTMLRMRELAITSLAAFTKTPFMRQIRGGPLLDEIRLRIEQKSAGSSKLKLFVVSGHDLTLINLLRTLGFTERAWKPEYSASVLVELHRVGQELQVQVWFDNGYEPESVYEPLKLPFCDSPCPLSSFLENTKGLVTTTWQQDCTSGPTDPVACEKA